MDLYRGSINIFVFCCYFSTMVSPLTLKRSAAAECSYPTDCAEGKYCESGFCKLITTTGGVVAKQCSRFKHRCRQDADCYCATEELMCSKNECVYSRNKQKVTTCASDCQCDHVYICDNNRCRESVDYEELMRKWKCRPDEERVVDLKLQSDGQIKKKDAFECLDSSYCSEEELCIKKTCISRQSLLEETMCVFRLSGRSCTSDKQCQLCGKKRALWTCQNSKCERRIR